MAPTAEPILAARSAGLRYVSVSPLGKGITRKKHGKGFRYVDTEGRTVRAADELRRIRALAIPPAWTDVWICPSPQGHIQAIGRDARGRRQYRYHAKWREVRDETKYGQLLAFGRVLPAVRRRVGKDLAKPGVPRDKVIATIVELLDRTMMRVGNEEYARQNDSYGLTTLRNRHARVQGSALELRFRGKSGKEHRVRVEDRRLARVVRTLQDLPGQELFQYAGEDGTPSGIDSSDVNAYLREVGGEEISAKVFRTWAGTVRALAALRAIIATAAKGEPADEPTKTETTRTLVDVVKGVASSLGNTPAVARKGYIHPGVLESFQRGTLGEVLELIAARPRRRTARLDADEQLTLAFLAEWQRREKRKPTLAQALGRSVRKIERPAARGRRVSKRAASAP